MGSFVAVLGVAKESEEDYGQDRMIRKADLPIFSAEGVSGVIDGKLYVLPGTCSTDA